MKEGTILVVDDEVIIIELFKEIFKKVNYNLYTAQSAKEALQICEEVNIDMVLTDINLGGDMDGISLCTRLKYLNKNIVVIAMTGYFPNYPFDYCASIGFRDILIKPIDMEELLKTVECTFDYIRRRNSYYPLV